MKTIKEILIERDQLTPEEAEEQIEEAVDQLRDYLDCGEKLLAMEITHEYFNLEPDHLMELVNRL